MQTSKGHFDITRTAEPPYDTAPGATLGKSRFEKRFHGDLDATSTVEMIGAMTEVKGSAGYVAIERVIGKLGGREGTFVLQHSATARRGETSLSITVVPDSATGALIGLSGSMKIDVVEGRHHYTFDHDLES